MLNAWWGRRTQRHLWSPASSQSGWLPVGLQKRVSETFWVPPAVMDMLPKFRWGLIIFLVSKCRNTTGVGPKMLWAKMSDFLLHPESGSLDFFWGGGLVMIYAFTQFHVLFRFLRESKRTGIGTKWLLQAKMDAPLFNYDEQCWILFL